jgi:hypothetical protein
MSTLISILLRQEGIRGIHVVGSQREGSTPAKLAASSMLLVPLYLAT